MDGKKEAEELKLCNCDGFWHVECPDGITRYVDVRDYRKSLLQELEAEVVGEDEPNMYDTFDWTPEKRGRNALRAEQRVLIAKKRQGLK